MIHLKKTLFNKCAVALICGTAMFSLVSCTKSDDDDDDDDLGNWTRSYDFEGVARTEAVEFTIGNQAYVGTGYKQNDDRLRDFWVFDQATGTWYQKADMPEEAPARNSAVAFAINGKGYIGTGYDGTSYLKDFWQYNPDDNTWTKKADFGGSARYGAVAFSLQGKGYIATGYDDNHLKDMWEYDPEADTWIQKASLSGSKRTDAVAFVINDKAYICTGLNNGTYVDDMWVYDPATNEWTQKRRIIDLTSDDDDDDDDEYDDDYDYNIVRSNATAFVLDGKAFITCGEYSGAIGSTWCYDPGTDLWDERTGFESSARVGAIGFTVNNKAYLTTGNNSNYRFDDMWEFKPYDEQEDND